VAVVAAPTKLLHNLLEKKAMILATKRSTIEVLGGKAAFGSRSSLVLFFFVCGRNFLKISLAMTT
jgi:hypothetical protein